MGRPKSYVREDAVRRARDAFWEHGFSRLGVRELEARSGINRFALARDFGGKEALFVEALADYAVDAETYLFGPLRVGDVDAIASVLEGLVTPFEGSPRRFGCLMVNTTVENARERIDAFQEKTDEHFRKLREAAEAALANEASRGTLAPHVDPVACGEFVVGCVVAANTLNRRAGSILGARRFIDVALTTVQSWRV